MNTTNSTTTDSIQDDEATTAVAIVVSSIVIIIIIALVGFVIYHKPRNRVNPGVAARYEVSASAQPSTSGI